MEIDRLLDSIRAAALDPGAWGAMQRESEAFFGACASQLGRADHADGNRFFSSTTRVPEIDAHIRELATVSEPVRFTAGKPHWRRFVDHDYIDEAGIARSAFYRECAQFDIGYRLALRVVDEPRVSKAMLWFWTPRQGHPQQVHLERLAAIEAPLRLAAHVADRLGTRLEAERGMVDALERARMPALLLDPGTQVLHANAAAHAILAARDGIVLGPGGRLEIAARPARDALHAALARAVGIGTGGSCAVPRPSGLPPLMLTIARLPERPRLFHAPLRTVLVLLADPAAADGPPEAVLAPAFGLTPAEAETAAMFAKGHAPDAIAARRGVARETVRRQMKALMAKTGTARQAELMRLLLAFRGVG